MDINLASSHIEIFTFWFREIFSHARNEKHKKFQSNLACRHGPRDQALEREFLLLQIVGGAVFDFELTHGVAKGSLDLLLCTPLELQGQSWVGGDLLNTGDVGLQLLSCLEFLAKSVIRVLEFGGVCRFG